LSAAQMRSVAGAIAVGLVLGRRERGWKAAWSSAR